MRPNSLLRRFLESRQGAVSIIGAVTLPVLLAIAALVADYGYGLLTKSEHQRVADLASYAGALAYNGSEGSTTAMTNAASALAALNGVPASEVSATLIDSPKTSGSKAVSVTISSTNTLLFAKALGRSSDLPVASGAAAEVRAGAGPCIIALNANQAGVTLSGGTAVSATTCTVSSNTSLTVPCGTTVTARGVTYNTSVPIQGCSGIRGPNGGAASVIKQVTSDPLADNATVATLRSRLSSVSGMTAPSAPTAPTFAGSTGTDMTDFGWKGPAGSQALTGGASGCTWSWGNWDGLHKITCIGNGPFAFGALNFSGVSLDFNSTGSPSATYTFSGSLTLSSTTKFGPGTYKIKGGLSGSGGTVTFGAGTFAITQGLAMANSGTMTFGDGNVSVGQAIAVSGSAVLTFGAGTFKATQGVSTSGSAKLTFGAGTFNLGGGSCNGSTFSICNTSSTPTVFGGPSAFNLSSGIYNGGGSTLTLGSGTTNSYQVGPSGSGYALYVGGGANTSLADAALFQFKGNIGSGGGACTVLSGAAQHDIAGSIDVGSGISMGAGTYTLTGYMALGSSGGGATNCNGATIGLRGPNVTIVVGAAPASSSGSCSGNAFCAAAGFNNITLTAPASGNNAKLAVIGPATATAGALFTSGASGVSVSGTFYFPSGPVSLGGGASLGNGAGQCLELIGSRVDLTGGTAVASTCITGSNSGNAVSLVK